VSEIDAKGSSLLIRHAGGDWASPAVIGYANEAELQTILNDRPDLIPGVTPPLAVCTEFQSGAGPADVVIIQGDGSVMVVECKLAQNPQVRREIIGQVLDYCSRIWRMPIAEFESRWLSRTNASPFDPFGDRAIEVAATVAENLDQGRFTMVLAVDGINPDLQRIVEYLNAITKPETSILAFELARVADRDVDVLMPRVYGQELIQAKAPADHVPWSVEEYLTWVGDNDPDALPNARAFIDGLRASGFVVSGGRALSPSLNVSMDVPRIGRKWPIALYTYKSGAKIEARIGDFKSTPDVAERFASEISGVASAGVSLGDIRAAEYAKYPAILLRNLTSDDVLSLVAAFLRAIGPTAEHSDVSWI